MASLNLGLGTDIMDAEKKNVSKKLNAWKKEANAVIFYQKQILAKLVDFPTPFTPQNVITKGFPAFLDETISRRMSIRRLGVNKANNDSVKTSLTVRWMLCNSERML
jgi:hypothetical protein